MNDEGVRHKAQVASPAELAAAREARGMSQLDISQRIKLQVKQVNALEEGQWEALPGKSFVRGALRSYGKLLDVDVAPLLESIGGFAEPAQVQGMKPLDAPLSRSSGLGFNGGGRGSTILWVIAGLIGVVALVLYFGSDTESSRIRSWLPSSDKPAGTATDPAVPVAPAAPSTPSGGSPSPAGGDGAAPAAPSPSGSAAPGSSSLASAHGSAAGANGSAASPDGGLRQPVVLRNLQELPQVATAGSAAGGQASSGPVSSGSASGGSTFGGASDPSQATAGPVAIAPPAAAATPAEPPTAAAVDVKGVMQVNAKQDSWIEIRQADGTALHNGLLKAGASIELKGSPPYRVVLGNASHVELSYEGKPQDLAPHIRANNIARLQLR